MLSAPQRHTILLALFLAAPALSFASSVLVNSTCEAGTCPTVDTLASGGSASGTFNVIYVAADGDWYDIMGNYGASNPASGDTSIVFNASATYEGLNGINNTASAGADTFTVSDLQDYNLASSTYFTTYGTLNGYYTEDTNSGIAGPAGSSWQAQLFFNGQALPVLGPFTGPGSASNGSGTALTGFGSASTLDADFVFTYDFAQGTPQGAGFTSTPEPGGLVPVAMVLGLCLGIGYIRRSRISKNICVSPNQESAIMV
jgi:hypothetical protein